MSKIIDPDKDYDELDDDELRYLLDRGEFDDETAAKVKEYLDSDGEENEDGLDSMKVPELRKIAEEEEIDLGDAKRKGDIVTAIRDARAAAEEE